MVRYNMPGTVTLVAAAGLALAMAGGGAAAGTAPTAAPASPSPAVVPSQSPANVALAFPESWGQAERARAGRLKARPYYDASEHQRVWTISSFFETSDLSGFGKVTPDTDCAVLSIGAMQRIFGDVSARRMLSLVEGPVLDRLLKQLMPHHGQKLKAALVAGTQEKSLDIVRSWQTPAFAPGDCTGAKTSRNVILIVDPAALPSDDPAVATGYAPIASELKALLSTPEVVEAQKLDTIKDFLCARWLAAVWRTRLSRKSHPGVTAADDKAAQGGGSCGEPPLSLDGLEKPTLADVALFYDIGLQPGHADTLELQRSAAAIASRRLGHSFHFATQAQRLDWSLAPNDRFSDSKGRTDGGLVRDGKVNGELWQERHKAGCYAADQERLAVLVLGKMLQAKSSVFRTVANRKLTLVLGEGCVNGRAIDLTLMFRGGAKAPVIGGTCEKKSFAVAACGKP